MPWHLVSGLVERYEVPLVDRNVLVLVLLVNAAACHGRDRPFQAA